MSEQNVRIRSAALEDLPELARILYASELGKKYYPTEKMLLHLMNTSFPHDEFHILCHGEEIAGFIWFQKEGAFHTFTYLQMIYLKEKYQHLGYGKMLMEFLEHSSLMNEGKKKLQSKIFLVVGVWNNSAKDFYLHRGFSLIGRVPGLFRRKIDENLMMKECFSLK